MQQELIEMLEEVIQYVEVWKSQDQEVIDKAEALIKKAKNNAPAVPDGLQWFTVAEHGIPEIGAEVIGGLWYTDPWIKTEFATTFMWGQCRVVESKHRDFKDGKQWCTFGPSHNQITHWARINTPGQTSAPAPAQEVVLTDEFLKEAAGSPEGYKFAAKGISKIDVWPHGGNWFPLYSLVQVQAIIAALRAKENKL